MLTHPVEMNENIIASVNVFRRRPLSSDIARHGSFFNMGSPAKPRMTCAVVLVCTVATDK